MTVMSSSTRDSDVEDVAREAGLTQEQTQAFRNVAASMAQPDPGSAAVPARGASNERAVPGYDR